MPTTKPKTKTAAKKPAKAPAARMSFQEVMTALEKAGSAQTKKTYLRHGATEPMFGVSFATLKVLYKKIKVDQELAEKLWDTGNFDALNLAVKIADPANISAKELDRWAATQTARMCGGYVAHLTAESPHARAKADKWLKAKDAPTRFAAWSLVAAMALIDEATEDSWFTDRLAQIEKEIEAASNTQKYAMNSCIIAIGCHNAALRKAALATAKRLGVVEVDHGDTDCKTPLASDSIEKAWARSKAGGFESPAAAERARESMRTRC